MGIIQKDALRTMIISYFGLVLGYLNKGVLFLLFLKTEEIGLINLVVSIGFLFAQFANLGSIFTIWKFYPFFKNDRNNDNGFLAFNFITILIGVSIFSILYLILKEDISYLYMQRSSRFLEHYYLVLPVGIGFGFYLLFDNYLRSLYKNIVSVFVNDIFLRLLNTLLIVIYGFDLISFDFLITSICLSYVLPPIILYFYMRVIGKGTMLVSQINVPKRFRKIILSYSAFSYFNSMTSIVVITIDTVMVASFLGLKETGVYTTMVYFTSVFLIPYRSLLRVSNPIVSEQWKLKDMNAMSILYKKMSSVVLVIGLFLFFLVWINRVELFGFLPEDFNQGIYVFSFLMIGKLVDMYFGLNGTIFVTSKKYKYDIIFTICLLFIVIAMNLVLIPIYGMIGAAISTSFAYLVYNFGRLIFVWNAFSLNPFKLGQLKVFILFSGLYALFEIISISTGNIFANIIIRWSIYMVIIGFAFLIIKIEPEISDYFDLVIKKIKKKRK